MAKPTALPIAAQTAAPTTLPAVVLGSSSRYRTALLKRILPHFDTASPNLDETPIAGESAADTALRLAQQKCKKIAPEYPSHITIGSDQVAALNTPSGFVDEHLNKPGDFDNAFSQLKKCIGNSVTYHTACCLIHHSLEKEILFIDQYTLHFRDNISDQQLSDYLRREKPFDCAGSIKAEALGIALIAAHEGSDPSTLMGLPLIKLIDALSQFGLEILAD